jgi:hypothetical protein
MKRDMDLIRDILLVVEKQDHGGLIKVEIEGHSPHDINYHMVLLRDAGLVEAAVMQSQDELYVQPIRLTWAGHEFIDSARSSKVWEGAKTFAMKTTGTLTLEALKLAIPIVIKNLMSM